MLSHVQNRYIERRILHAPTEADALAFIRHELNSCGSVGPGCSDRPTHWFEGHNGDLWAWFGCTPAPALGERFALIRAVALVSRVRAGGAPQPSLFEEANCL